MKKLMKLISIQKIKQSFNFLKKKKQNTTNIPEVSEEDQYQLLDDMRSEYGYDDEE
jgi:hypothetical protein